MVGQASWLTTAWVLVVHDFYCGKRHMAYIDHVNHLKACSSVTLNTFMLIHRLHGSCTDSTTVCLQNFFIFPSWNTNSPLLFLQSLETTIVLLILGGICPEVKLVGHIVVLYLIFWGPTIPFSMGTIPFSQGICPTLCSISNGQEFSNSAQLHQQLLFSVFFLFLFLVIAISIGQCC